MELSVEGREDFVFKNWAKTFSCKPKLYFQPQNVKELKLILRKAKSNKMKVKVVGGGISPSDIACTNDYMISMKNFNRVLAVDDDHNQITVQAGVTIEQLNCIILPEFNMALTNQAVVAWQTVAGMMGTGSHGTGAKYGSFSSFVLGVTVMTADGSILKCSAEENSDVFAALRCHLGILGIIIDVTLQCEPAFDLVEKRCSSTLQELLPSLDHHLSSSDYFRFYWFPHTDYVTTFSSNKEKQQRKVKKASWIREVLINHYLLEFCLWLASLFPVLLPFITLAWFKLFYSDKHEQSGQSYEVLNVKCSLSQFVAEWAIPRKYTRVVLSQMRDWLNNHPKVKAHFPVEVRFVKQDDILMTPSGDEDVTYVGIISMRPYGVDVPKQEWWDFFENLAMKYGGKPHWGKANKANEIYLQKVYKGYDQFMEIRERLDPERMFFNEYWMRVMIMN